MRSRPHDGVMAELFRDEPALALEVINGILADGDQAELMTVLRQLAQAPLGICKHTASGIRTLRADRVDARRQTCLPR